MHLSVSRWFSQSDLDRIKAAVRDAEQKTSGEIVPYVVDHCDHYEEAEWRFGALLGALALGALLFLRESTSLGWGLDLLWIGVLTLAAAAAGIILVKFTPSLKRFWSGHGLIDRRVSQRAAEAFITEEVFNTERRTGVLLFVSLLERRVLVVGDSGINAKVEKADWNAIVQKILRGIRAGRPAEGLIDAIEHSGMLLEKHGLHRRRDDKDELPDSLRMSDT